MSRRLKDCPCVMFVASGETMAVDAPDTASTVPTTAAPTAQRKMMARTFVAAPVAGITVRAIGRTCSAAATIREGTRTDWRIFVFINGSVFEGGSFSRTPV